ncbi:hypothetical protein HBF24_09880 [Oleiagrimonas sp. C23AA]|nr:hypothetical protein [Oleiagrimonas sp. C23AA]
MAGFIGLVWRLLLVGAVVHEVNASMESVQRFSQQQAQHMKEASDRRERIRNAQHIQRLFERTLAKDQQCVGGTVVTVTARSAVQLIHHGHVVSCRGRMADEALR